MGNGCCGANKAKQKELESERKFQQNNQETCKTEKMEKVEAAGLCTQPTQVTATSDPGPYTRDDLSHFIDDDEVSEIIDERNYMESIHRN